MGGMNPALPGLDPASASVSKTGSPCRSSRTWPTTAGWRKSAREPATCRRRGIPVRVGRPARAQGAVQPRDEHTGLAQTVAVICGTSASLGRGGDPAVAWWLQPSPFDAQQTGRLSRRHLSLELRSGRAWATDGSTNGTWLNDERLTEVAAALVGAGRPAGAGPSGAPADRLADPRGPRA